MSRFFSACLHVACVCLVLGSCAAPKAEVVAEPKAKPGNKPADEEVSGTKPPDYGLRVGNMLDLPKEGEFRATNPSASRSGTGGSAVIISPTAKPAPDSAKPEPKSTAPEARE